MWWEWPRKSWKDWETGVDSEIQTGGDNPEAAACAAAAAVAEGADVDAGLSRDPASSHLRDHCCPQERIPQHHSVPQYWEGYRKKSRPPHYHSHGH